MDNEGVPQLKLLITGQQSPFARALAEAIQSRGGSVTFGDALLFHETALSAAASKVDVVIHLLGLEIEASGRERSDELHRFTEGTRNLLHACREASRPVLVGSTEAAYGIAPGALDESSPGVFGAGDALGLSQRLVEEQTIGTKDLRFGIARFVGLYGPWGSKSLNPLLDAIRSRSPLPLPGKMGDRHYFYHYEDAIDATLTFARCLTAGTCQGEVINLGNADGVSLEELSRILSSHTDHGRGYLEGSSALPGRPSLEKMTSMLQLEATTPIHQGILETVRAQGLLTSEAEPPPTPLPTLRPTLEYDMGLLLKFGGILGSGRLTNMGPEAEALEAELSDLLGSDHCLSCSSGSTALDLALKALTPAPGKAILPTFTYVATLNAIVNNGLEPVFCDIDPASWTMDPGHLEALLELHPQTSVVLPVNVFGIPPDLDRIVPLATNAQALTVYDNAHGLGTLRDGKPLDSRPDVTTFSLHATKLLPAGEGGALVAKDAELKAEIRRIRNHGLIDGKSKWSPGLNGKLDEMSAATARHQLSELAQILRRRREYGAWFREHLGNIAGVQLQHIPPNVQSNFQNLSVRLAWATESTILENMESLRARGIETKRYFHPLLHNLHGLSSSSLPHSEALLANHLCVPIYSRMEPRELRRIRDAIAQLADDDR